MVTLSFFLHLAKKLHHHSRGDVALGDGKQSSLGTRKDAVWSRFDGPTIFGAEHPCLRELLASPTEDGTSWPLPSLRPRDKGIREVPCS